MSKTQDGEYNYLIPFHDGWLALIAHATGGSVIVDDAPCMDYRQHGNNEVGASRTRIEQLKGRIKRFLNPETTRLKSRKCLTLLAVMGDDLPEDTRIVIRKFATYRESLISRVRLAFDLSIYHYGPVTDFGTFCLILMGRL